MVNIVSEEIAEKMNLCSGDYPYGADEFEISGLTAVPSDLVRPPRVRESHVNMECKLIQIVDDQYAPVRRQPDYRRSDPFPRGRCDRSTIFGSMPTSFEPSAGWAVTSIARTRDRFEMIRPKVSSYDARYCVRS